MRKAKPSKANPPANQTPQLTPEQRQELHSLPRHRRQEYLMQFLRQTKDQPPKGPEPL